MVTSEGDGSMDLDRERVMALLGDVMDPEIPRVSIVDLGMVERIGVNPDGVVITLIPTYMGCPATRLIAERAQTHIADALEMPRESVRVKWSTEVAWSTDRVTDAGRRRLQEFGIGPPPAPGHTLLTLEIAVSCPRCGASNATLENLFGATACRSLYYCRQCKNPFEVMKPI